MQKTRKSQQSGGNPLRTRLLIAVGILAVAALLYIGRTIFSPNRQESTVERSESYNPVQSPLRADASLTFAGADGAGKSSVQVEVANDDASRTRGLMGRTSMSEDQGMLFIFEDTDVRSFWMVNTPLSLDIIFVGEDMSIVKIHQSTTPYSDASLESGAPAKYVVETNAGYCARHGIVEGDKIRFTMNGAK